MTPLATSLCVSLLSEVGFPPGVVNLVNGTGLDLLEPLCASKVPRLLTRIGSTAMGRRMSGYSATSFKRFSLELGWRSQDGLEFKQKFSKSVAAAEQAKEAATAFVDTA